MGHACVPRELGQGVVGGEEVATVEGADSSLRGSETEEATL